MSTDCRSFLEMCLPVVECGIHSREGQTYLLLTIHYNDFRMWITTRGHVGLGRQPLLKSPITGVDRPHSRRAVAGSNERVGVVVGIPVSILVEPSLVVDWVSPQHFLIGVFVGEVVLHDFSFLMIMARRRKRDTHQHDYHPFIYVSFGKGREEKPGNGEEERKSPVS